MLGTIFSYLAERPLIEEVGPSARRLTRQDDRRRMATALLWAAVFHFSLASVWLGARFRTGTEEEVIYTTITFDNILPPQSLRERPEPPQRPVFAPRAKPPSAPPAGEPVPVPAVAAEALTISDQIQNTMVGATTDTGLGDHGSAGDLLGAGAGGALIVIDDGAERPDPKAPAFVEKEPELVAGTPPVYPELARLSQIEGTVVVRALVGRDGRVKETLLVRGVHDLLDRAALEAATSYVFLPAIQNERPVAVWVSIPFRFTLR
jgi:protein TonB